ncbi:MAG TPA: ATP-binding protein, partial [Syntrophorhabdaceae bacterium]|nr:ATP-binding protein [Syntrophorhabdaceae bacterium]
MFQGPRSDKYFSVLKIVLIYAFFGTCWIYSSDTILGWLVKDPVIITRIAVLKGVFFIVSTSVLLYFLVNAYVDRLTKAATRRRQAEDQLAISDQSLRAILQASPIGIGRARGRTLEWANEALCRITGYGLEQILGRSSRILYENDAEFERVGNALYREGVVATRWVRKDGQIRSVSIQAIQTSSLAFVFTAMDMTEHMNLELQLRQAQKMEAIGTLAGGVAHDFNNILTVMIGFATLVQAKMDKTDPLLQHVEQIIASGYKASNLTRSLLAFSRKQPLSLAPMSVNCAIKATEKMLERLLTEDIELVVALAADDIIIMADATQIDQILFNLATNARDAMKRGGRLTIETMPFRIDSKFVEFYGYGEPGSYCLLRISDTGCGMDEMTMQKIFDPFFTTKELGKGTGLGLSTVYGIVKQHKGYINVSSQPGRGATFSIY